MQLGHFKCLFLFAFFVACTPAEFDSLDDVTLACSSDDDCPEGYYCEGRLDPSECLKTGERDEEAPELSELSLNLTQAKAGDELVAAFVSNEPLLLEESSVSLNGIAFAFDEAQSDVANLSFVYRYTLTGEEGDGTKVVRADVVDEGGSAGQTDIGSVDLDFTVPTVTLSTNLPNYREGEVVTLTVLASETLAQAPTLEIKQNDTVITDFFTLNAEASQEGTYVYESVTIVRDVDAVSGQASAYDGSYEVSVAGFQDVLGNVGAASPTAVFEVDATEPAFSKMKLYRFDEDTLVNGWAFNAQAILVVCFDFKEANLEGDITVQMQGHAFTPSEVYGDLCAATTEAQAYGYGLVLQEVLGGSDAGVDLEEGYTFISLEATDQVGNRGLDNVDGIVLDFTPPELESASVSTQLAQKGEMIFVDLVANEALQDFVAADLVVTGPNTLPFLVTGNSQFRHQAQEGDDGAYHVSVFL
ncbi:MAG: hypothetical protein CMH56_03410, partial [Myxococcales bacterium]|nr:hypothetical protein [Myxococcales bacterium]